MHNDDELMTTKMSWWLCSGSETPFAFRRTKGIRSSRAAEKHSSTLDSAVSDVRTRTISSCRNREEASPFNNNIITGSGEESEVVGIGITTTCTSGSATLAAQPSPPHATPTPTAFIPPAVIDLNLHRPKTNIFTHSYSLFPIPVISATTTGRNVKDKNISFTDHLKDIGHCPSSSKSLTHSSGNINSSERTVRNANLPNLGVLPKRFGELGLTIRSWIWPTVSADHTKHLVLLNPKEEKMKEDRQFEFIFKSLLSGGIAGMCAKTAVAPLDRIKILLQAHSKHYCHLGVFSGLKGIVEKERFFALYKGNGAQMVRIFPYAATQFTSFEMYKKLFGEDSHIGRFCAGSAAGVTAVALTYPLDTIRARLAFQVSGEHLYSGIYQCALHIFREEGGVRALYRGFAPTIVGMIPYAGLSFYCFESFKYLCMKFFPDVTCSTHSKNTGGLVLLMPYKLLCGGMAGAVAQTVSYPLDVTRRRMQLAMMDEKTRRFGMGMTSTLKIIYQEDGISRGLYRGMSINYLRAIPMVAVSFTTYEMVKQLLNLDTGLAIKTG